MDDSTEKHNTHEGSIPTVTIGLPVYNGEKFLAETIESLLSQTFEDFELIISDNASTDATEKICRARAKRDPRIRYVRQPQNIGSYNNFNFLVRQARGHYFKWAAADDLIAPTFLARCLEILENEPAHVLCHSDTITIGSDRLELPNDIIRSSGASENDMQHGASPYPPWKRFRDVLLGSTAVMDLWGVIRTNVLRTSGLLQPCMGYEKVLIAELSLHGRFWQIPERLFAYRIHLDQISSQTSPDAQWERFKPRTKSRTYPRFQYLRGYVGSVFRTDLSYPERILCFSAIGRNLLELKKWKRTILEVVFAKGFGDGNAEILGSTKNSNRQRQLVDLWH